MKFVFQIRSKQGYTIKEYADEWKQANAASHKMPGDRGTYLHRGIGDTATLLAIAAWDSKASRDQAMATLQDNLVSRDIIDRHLTYGEVSLVGEFEQPEWQMTPSGFGDQGGPCSRHAPNATNCPGFVMLGLTSGLVYGQRYWRVQDCSLGVFNLRPM